MPGNGSGPISITTRIQRGLLVAVFDVSFDFIMKHLCNVCFVILVRLQQNLLRIWAPKEFHQEMKALD